jgi:hypothetical protein
MSHSGHRIWRGPLQTPPSNSAAFQLPRSAFPGLSKLLIASFLRSFFNARNSSFYRFGCNSERTKMTLTSRLLLNSGFYSRRRFASQAQLLSKGPKKSNKTNQVDDPLVREASVWHRDHASASEIDVLADRTDSGSIEKLQKDTINHLQENHCPAVKTAKTPDSSGKKKKP